MLPSHGDETQDVTVIRGNAANAFVIHLAKPGTFKVFLTVKGEFEGGYVDLTIVNVPAAPANAADTIAAIPPLSPIAASSPIPTSQDDEMELVIPPSPPPKSLQPQVRPIHTNGVRPPQTDRGWTQTHDRRGASPSRSEASTVSSMDLATDMDLFLQACDAAWKELIAGECEGCRRRRIALGNRANEDLGLQAASSSTAPASSRRGDRVRVLKVASSRAASLQMAGIVGIHDGQNIIVDAVENIVDVVDIDNASTLEVTPHSGIPFTVTTTTTVTSTPGSPTLVGLPIPVPDGFLGTHLHRRHKPATVANSPLLPLSQLIPDYPLLFHHHLPDNGLADASSLLHILASPQGPITPNAPPSSPWDSTAASPLLQTSHLLPSSLGLSPASPTFVERDVAAPVMGCFFCKWRMMVGGFWTRWVGGDRSLLSAVQRVVDAVDRHVSKSHIVLSFLVVAAFLHH
ncbi:hypothetical protein BV25DRAFT_1921659 [Artomyces pyxidatus]|uniref:Uncharacterized protein n=1 Tax=Artomyces pyxidatus TaxID=48021 RepID=A0ACB8SIG3_9AGAM|nr:hypothetical protein BV25DRAFT_1921659 [Artomyces pyxidatus]